MLSIFLQIMQKRYKAIRIPWPYKYIDESPEVEPLAQYEQQLKNITKDIVFFICKVQK